MEALLRYDCEEASIGVRENYQRVMSVLGWVMRDYWLWQQCVCSDCPLLMLYEQFLIEYFVVIFLINKCQWLVIN